MNPPTDLETRLRASLRENARHAPPDGPLAERILAELDAPVLRPHRSWRTWTFPLLAAAAIAAVALTLAGVGADRHTAAPVAPGTHPVTHPAPTVHVTQPVISTPTPTDSGPTPPTATAALQPVTGFTNFQAIDTTFVGPELAWALGDANCTSSGDTVCAALARSQDAGATWSRVALPNGLTIPLQTCAANCVSGIRFANNEIGYLFGPSTFLVTTNGGETWSHESGGADAVETLDETVIRVAKNEPTCQQSCAYSVTYSGISTSTWQSAQIAAVRGDHVQLVRAKGTSYLLVRNGTSGQLFHSADGGATWDRVPACAGVSEVALNVGRLNLLCGDEILVGANSAHAVRAALPSQAMPSELSAVGKQTLFVASDKLWRSTDSGTKWQVVLERPGNSDLGPPGFQSETLGRWVTDGGRTIWTTVDGGATWTGIAFSQ